MRHEQHYERMVVSIYNSAVERSIVKKRISLSADAELSAQMTILLHISLVLSWVSLDVWSLFMHHAKRRQKCIIQVDLMNLFLYKAYEKGNFTGAFAVKHHSEGVLHITPCAHHLAQRWGCTAQCRWLLASLEGEF